VARAGHESRARSGGVFDPRNRLVVLVSMNSDVSDSWDREGDSRE
jgi:hypothetical protein